MELKEYPKYILIVLFVIILYLSWRVVKPYAKAVVAACVIAYLFHPLYLWICKKIKKKALSSLIVVLIIFLIAAVPLALVLISAVNEVDNTIIFLQTEFGTKNPLDFNCIGNQGRICTFFNKVEAMVPGLDIKNSIISTVKSLKSYALNLLTGLTSGVLQFFIVLYMTFYLLIDGEKLVVRIKDLLSLKKSYEDHFTQILHETTHAVVFGNLVTAFVQGAVAAVGYWLIGGFGSAILLGVATAFFALLPFFGSSIVWFPAAFYMLFNGIVDSSTGTIIRAIVLFLYGFLIVSTIDNLIKPKLIGNRARIHPVIVLIGVLGGVTFLGVIGIIIGPIILAFLIQFLRLAEIEKTNN
jgi:predicted PurR-regulated permease PerM